MQILLGSDGLPGAAAPERAAPSDPLAAQKDLLEDFLSRLQAIVRRPRGQASGTLDDTRPGGRRSRS